MMAGQVLRRRYYPGTASIGEAQRVTLGIGETLTDITIPLVH